MPDGNPGTLRARRDSRTSKQEVQSSKFKEKSEWRIGMRNCECGMRKEKSGAEQGAQSSKGRANGKWRRSKEKRRKVEKSRSRNEGNRHGGTSKSKRSRIRN